jgi:hypothetical protein
MSDVVAAPPPLSRSARSRAFTREVWMDRLARFPASGLTAAQFCAVEAVSVATFYFWKRRLAAEAKAATAAESGADLGPHLLPIQVPSAAATVELVLASGVVLRLPPGSDLAWVRSLVAALGESSC